MEMDLRNMIAIAGVLFGIIALGISGGAYGKIQNVDECCGGNTEGCPKVDIGSFEITCATPHSCDDENAIAYEGCCYTFEANAGQTAVIFCAITLGCIIFTGVMGECLENCPACCQNCSACILGFVNILGLAFVGLVIGFSFSSPDSEEGCDASLVQATATEGMTWAYLIFLALAQLMSCAVAVMSSSCCQKDEGED